jgi:hypothetical protein
VAESRRAGFLCLTLGSRVRVSRAEVNKFGITFDFVTVYGRYECIEALPIEKGVNLTQM